MTNLNIFFLDLQAFYHLYQFHHRYGHEPGLNIKTNELELSWSSDFQKCFEFELSLNHVWLTLPFKLFTSVKIATCHFLVDDVSVDFARHRVHFYAVFSRNMC